MHPELELEDAKPETTSLYLKDIKMFLGLKKAANNCDRRKRENYVVQGNPERMLVSE